MSGYEFLEHTADIKIRASGMSLEEAFSNVVLAVTHELIPPQEVKETEEHTITVESKTKENLLYDTIQELVFLIDTEGFIACKVKSLKIIGEGPYKLIAELSGDKVSNYAISGDIKNATYTEMLIKKEKDEWIIETVLDI